MSRPGLELDLADLRCFLGVVTHGNFSRAAEALGLPKATVSRRVAALEARLGTALLARTTRSVRVTAAGAAYARRAEQALLALDAADAEVADQATEPTGCLRLLASPEYGMQVLAPRLAAFQAAHPGLTVELELAERQADLVFEGLDLAIRVGPADADPAAERIDTLQAGVYASPDLLARLGPLDYVHQLAGLPAVLPAGVEAWVLTDGAQTLELPARPVLRADAHGVRQAAAAAGLGLALIDPRLAPGVDADPQLVRVFPAWQAPGVPVYAVAPAARVRPSRVSALLAALAAARPD